MTGSGSYSVRADIRDFTCDLFAAGPNYILRLQALNFTSACCGLSSLRLRRVPSFLWLRLGQSSHWLRHALPFLRPRLVPPPLWLNQALPSLRLHHCPHSLWLCPGLPSLHFHLGPVSLWLHLSPSVHWCNPGSSSPQLRMGLYYAYPYISH